MKEDKQIKMELEERINNKQNEYQEILLGLRRNGSQMDKDETLWSATSSKFHYNWERLKVLQKEIISLTHFERERSSEIAKQALEEAFTPKLKKMLSDKLQHEIDE